MRSLLFCLLFIVTAGCEPEAEPAPAPPPSPQRLKVMAPAPMAVAPGESATIAVPIEIGEAFHVQANQVPFDYLIPTVLTLNSTELFEVGAPEYPSGKPYTLEGSTDTLMVYGGMFDIEVPVAVNASAEAGVQTLEGTLRYQACDDRMCFAPKTIPVEVAVEVTQ